MDKVLCFHLGDQSSNLTIDYGCHPLQQTSQYNPVQSIQQTNGTVVKALQFHLGDQSSNLSTDYVCHHLQQASQYNPVESTQQTNQQWHSGLNCQSTVYKG